MGTAGLDEFSFNGSRIFDGSVKIIDVADKLLFLTVV